MRDEVKGHGARGRWFSSEIYFGRHFPGHGQISEQQFDRFLARVVTPAFPLGMTVYDAYGQMQHHSGQIVRQKTKVVVLVHDGSKANDEAISNIIAAYREEFGNPQVMLLTKPVKPAFWPD